MPSEKVNKLIDKELAKRDAKIKKQFEKALAEEMDGWMNNFAAPIEYVMKRIVNGDVDEKIRPYTDEAEPFIKQVAQDFVAAAPHLSNSEAQYHEEGVATAIHAAQALASGDAGKVEEQLLVYLSEAKGEGRFTALTYENIAKTYKGDFVGAAKALANAVVILGNRKLPYPHS